MLCDIARKTCTCMEEAPLHTMPAKITNFDCRSYIAIPVADLEELGESIMTAVLQKAFSNLADMMEPCINMYIEVEAVQQVADKKYVVLYIVFKGGLKAVSQQRTMEILL